MSLFDDSSETSLVQVAYSVAVAPHQARIRTLPQQSLALSALEGLNGHAETLYAALCSYAVVCFSMLAVVIVIAFAIRAMRATFFNATPQEVECAIFVRSSSDNDTERNLDAPETSRAGLSRRPPWVIVACVVVSSFLRNMDLTISMPTAEMRTIAVGGDLTSSGAVIGAPGISGVLGVPMGFVLVNAAWGGFRSCYVMFAILMLVGNLTYIFGGTLLALILAGVVKGFAAGGIIRLNLYAFTVFTSPDQRVSLFAMQVGSGLFGSAAGPAIASILFSTISHFWHRADTIAEMEMVSPAMLMCVLHVAFGIFAAFIVPGMDKLVAHESYQRPGSTAESAGSPEHEWSDEDAARLKPMLRFEKYLVLASCAWLAFVREISRWGFEAAQLTVLDREYNLPTSQTSLVLSLYVACGAIGSMMLMRNRGGEPREKRQVKEDMRFMLLMGLCLVVPPLLTWRFAAPPAWQWISFLVTSAAFYTSNVRTTSLINALATQIAPDLECFWLQKQGILIALGLVGDGAAVFCGPFFMRLVLNTFGQDQAILGLTIFTLNLMQMVVWNLFVPPDSCRQSVDVVKKGAKTC